MTFYDKCIDCGKLLRECDRPDFFTDAGKVRLLREIMKEKDYGYFILFLYSKLPIRTGKHPDFEDFIKDYILDDTGKLVKAFVEWGRENIK